MIELIPMNQEQITAVYHEAMEQDFPANELKPLRMILQLMESGDYDSLMITNEGITVGYVLLMFPGREQVGLIDYLAIYPEQRSLGFGGKVLQKLKEYYPDGILYLECEHPTDAPKPQLAERRIRFYERNGAVRIPLESKVFGAHYCHMVILGSRQDELPDIENIGHHKNAMTRIYAAMIPDENVRKNQLIYW